MASIETPLGGLLEANKAWATIFNKDHPGFLKKLAKDPQRPKFLWIGCSDSRVPETFITESLPGDIFVQRNIANQIPSHDINSNAVLAYAVGHLEVKNIVVVGHTGCGGIKAAYDEVHHHSHVEDPHPGEIFIHDWIQPIVKLVPPGPPPPPGSEKEKEVLNALSEANVKSQILNIKKSGLLKSGVSVYGLIYNLETGILREVS